MNAAQRAATIEMCAAILRCSTCTPDMRFRARNLQVCVALDAMWAEILG